MRASSSSSSTSGSSQASRQLDVVGTMVDQPVAHRHRGANVVLVVAGDPIETGLVAVLHPVLVLDDGAGTAVDVVAALVVGELLDVLEAVGLDAHLHRAGDDREQVDEQPGRDQALQLQFGDAVVGGETHQRGPLGVVVVVHVHVREPAATLGEVLDEIPRRLRLFLLVVRPERLEQPLASSSRSMRPNRKNNPMSAFQNGWPSKSRNTSPSSGAGSAAKPGQFGFDRLDVEFR